MSNNDGNTQQDAFHATAFLRDDSSKPEQILEEVLADAVKLGVDPFVRSICNQFFDHTNPESLTGWEAELLIEAVSELVYCAKAQHERT